MNVSVLFVCTVFGVSVYSESSFGGRIVIASGIVASLSPDLFIISTRHLPGDIVCPRVSPWYSNLASFSVASINQQAVPPSFGTNSL